MVELIWESGFKKSYKKRIKNFPDLKEDFWESLNLFIKNPFDKSLKTHKLSGKFKGTWSFRINYEFRVVFEFENENIVRLFDIGTHDEVY